MRKEKEIHLLMQKALAPDVRPKEELNQEIIRKWDSRDFQGLADNPDFGNEVKGMGKRKIASIAAAAAVFVLAVSTTVVAAVKYLTREEIVTELGDDLTANAFQGDEALELNESAEAGDYRFNLYGVTTAEGLIRNGLGDDLGKQGGTYVVLSIERLDGAPMPGTVSEEYEPFFISPLIQGLEPWQYNMGSMGGATSTMVKDGVRYTIMECDDIAYFADRQIYLCILDTVFYEKDAYHYNETDGTIARNEDYEGLNLLMDLPIDKKRADEDKAQAYLEELEESWHMSEEEDAQLKEKGYVSAGCEVLDRVIEKEREKDASITRLYDIPLETLLSYGVLDEASVQEVTVAEDGTVDCSYTLSDGSEGSFAGGLGEDFMEGKKDIENLGWSASDTKAAITVCRRDADGTVKLMVYVIGE
ncbi:MAG: hypothetical protein NC307_01540 [Roseburia sp.]|nr:hypothetical protein [Roseburia sp.]